MVCIGDRETWYRAPWLVAIQSPKDLEVLPPSYRPRTVSHAVAAVAVESSVARQESAQPALQSSHSAHEPIKVDAWAQEMWDAYQEAFGPQL